MKKIILLFSVLILSSTWLEAQEHTGHGRGRRHQQQQQQMVRDYKRVVITGEKAAQKYAELLSKSAATDLSEQCSQQVSRVGYSHHSGTVCFDRGDSFAGGTRYKCYVKTKKEISWIRAAIFDATHNSCGGDGIHRVRKNKE